MTLPTTDPAADLIHRAVGYRDADHQAEVIAGPVADSLERGGRALVVVDPRCRSALEHRIGRDAGVRYAAPDRIHSAPPFTVAGRWSRAVRDAITDGAPDVCTVGQPLDLPGTDPSYWTRLDLALGQALRGLPVQMLCCFHDVGSARTDAAELHDELLVDGAPVPSTCRRDDRDLLAEHPQPPPVPLGEPLVVLPVELDRLTAMRRVVHRQAVLSGCGPGRADDLVLAVNELVSNGIEHGSGTPVLRMWRTGGSLVAEMSDPAAVHLPFPGLTAPPPSGRRGRGMWLAAQLTDVLQVWTAEDDPGRVRGTVVRVTTSPP